MDHRGVAASGQRHRNKTDGKGDIFHRFLLLFSLFLVPSHEPFFQASRHDPLPFFQALFEGRKFRVGLTKCPILSDEVINDIGLVR